jgi:hypothetical protein
MKICRENPNFLKVGHKYLAPYKKSYLRFIIADVIKSPLTPNAGIKSLRATLPGEFFAGDFAS